MLLGGASLWPELRVCFGDMQVRDPKRCQDGEHDDGDMVAIGQCLVVGCFMHGSHAFHILIRLTL